MATGMCYSGSSPFALPLGALASWQGLRKTVALWFMAEGLAEVSKHPHQPETMST